MASLLGQEGGGSLAQMVEKHFRTGCLEGDFGTQKFVLDTLNLRAQLEQLENEILGNSSVNESSLVGRTSLDISVWKASAYRK